MSSGKVKLECQTILHQTLTLVNTTMAVYNDDDDDDDDDDDVVDNDDEVFIAK